MSLGVKQWCLAAILFASFGAVWAAGNLVPKWNYYAPGAILFTPTMG